MRGIIPPEGSYVDGGGGGASPLLVFERCGTVMFYCSSGSGFYFGKILVPVLVLVPVFQQQKFFTKCCLFNAKSKIVSQKVEL